jgi:hypothetical protein
MDEFHFYAEPQRGWAWQVPILSLPQAQFLLMSATLGDVRALREDLTRRPDARPRWSTTPRGPCRCTSRGRSSRCPSCSRGSCRAEQAPIYVVHFTQASALGARAVAAVGQAVHPEERDAIADAIGGVPLHRRVRQDAVHGSSAADRRASRRHAAALPPARRAARADRLLKVICGTDTLGVGINVPIRTVVFTGWRSSTAPTTGC